MQEDDFALAQRLQAEYNRASGSPADQSTAVSGSNPLHTDASQSGNCIMDVGPGVPARRTERRDSDFARELQAAENALARQGGLPTSLNTAQHQHSMHHQTQSQLQSDAELAAQLQREYDEGLSKAPPRVSPLSGHLETPSQTATGPSQEVPGTESVRREQLVCDIYLKEGLDLQHARRQASEFLTELGLAVVDAGSMTFNGTRMLANQCFYLALARSSKREVAHKEHFIHVRETGRGLCQVIELRRVPWGGGGGRVGSRFMFSLIF